jgi:hypothetical protein
MTPLNFAIVGLRLMGIYFIVESGLYFAEAGFWNAWMGQIAPDANTSRPSVYFSAWIPAVLLVLLGGVLLIFSKPLARRLAPPVADEAGGNGCSFADVQAIAFAVAGLLILVSSLPHVGHALQNYRFWYYSQGDPNSPFLPLESLMYALGVTAQMILGLGLLVNPRGFRNLWHWLRTAGTRARDPN